MEPADVGSIRQQLLMKVTPVAPATTPLPHRPRTVGLQSSVIWSKSSSCVQELCKHKRSSSSAQDTSTLSLAGCKQWEQSSEPGSGRPSPSSCLPQSRLVWILPYGLLHCALGWGRLCPGADAGLCKLYPHVEHVQVPGIAWC